MKNRIVLYPHTGSSAYSPSNSRRNHPSCNRISRPSQTPSDPSSHFQPHPLLPHQLQLILRRPPRLRKTQTPLDTLQELPRHLIAHDMRRPLIALMQLLPRTALMDPHHRHANRPRRLADTQGQIPVVRIHVPALLRRAHNLHHRLQDPVFQRPFLEASEERAHVLAGLRHGAVGLLALEGFRDGGGARGERGGPFGQHEREVGG